MTDQNTPILYIKASCPWCVDAVNFFQSNNVNVELRDINVNPEFKDQLIAQTQQHKVPTFIHGDFVVKDFDIDEFKQALAENPSASARYNFN